MNLARMTATPSHIIERNRNNSFSSTGPKTPEGRVRSRQNALKHGLCANPAAGVVEDCGQFDKLQGELLERFQPRDKVEAGLIHRVAVSLWRLQRSARIDAAICNVGANEVSPARERVREWIDRISHDFWLLDYVEVRDKALIARRVKQGLLKRGDHWYRVERTFLGDADRLRDEEMMKDGAAIKAMAILIDTLVCKLEQHALFSPEDAQMLAWLMGESTERLRPASSAEDQYAMFYPDEQDWASRIDTLIGEARKRAECDPTPEALMGAVEVRQTCLRAQCQIVSDPHTVQQDRDRQMVGLLPDSATLDRLLRYETHAERSMHRSLEMLAKLRGVAIESISAAIIGPGPNGTTVEVRGQRTRWQS
jgi:hypothetical protein